MAWIECNQYLLLCFLQNLTLKFKTLDNVMQPQVSSPHYSAVTLIMRVHFYLHSIVKFF